MSRQRLPLNPAGERLEALLRQRIVYLDGAMGTMIQQLKLQEADYRGDRFKDHPGQLKGNNDLLVITKPTVVRDIHRAYLDAGADILETNTFNGTSIAMEDYAMTHLVRELNTEAVKVARQAVDAFKAANPGKDAFVAGAIGPTNKTLSMSRDVNDSAKRDVTFLQVRDAYREQVDALIDAGADLLLCETVFDTLVLKAALFAIDEAFEARGFRIPLMISGTITDASGRTLTGQTTEAFWNSVRHAQPISVGMNCALGGEQMRPHIAELAKKADIFVSCYPNAGLPNPLSPTGFPEGPEDTAAILETFARDGLVNIVGGCCGTTPGHIAAIRRRTEKYPPRVPGAVQPALKLSGLEPLNIVGGPGTFVNVGERTNVAGSKIFKGHIEKDDYRSALRVAKQQIEAGATVIDINFDAGLLDGAAAMTKFLNMAATEPDITKVPFMIDSSNFDIIEAGLRCVQGKAIVNSISLKEGQAEFVRRARLCRHDRHGLRREGPGRLLRGQGPHLRPRLRHPHAGSRRRPAGHHLRPEHPHGRHGHEGAQPLRPRLHRGRHGDQTPLPRRPHLGRPVQRLLRLRRQQQGPRSDPLRLPLSRGEGRPRHGHRQRGHARGLQRDRARTARPRRGPRPLPPR
jgi:5-methyltetrahydrofolate--homocysteine methyltransferase